jgi:hypothetical protein
MGSERRPSRAMRLRKAEWMADLANTWPELDWEGWRDTAETLHMMTQIVGKTRLELTPLRNHWWNVPLYVSARGLTTSAMPLAGGGLLEIEFDFIADQLSFRTSRGRLESIPLKPRPVAEFFAIYKEVLKKIGVAVKIYPMPVEVQNPIRFEQDTVHRSYDAVAARRFWHVLGHADNVLKRFSTGFVGKISPVHFFWGSFDLAVTRFNGRTAPPRPGTDRIQAEAYSHECISAGFWPGNGGYGKAAFYAYAAPAPPGLAECTLNCLGAFNRGLGEFLLDYDEVRRTPDPERAVLDFLNGTYDAAATACKWDRAALDRPVKSEEIS